MISRIVALAALVVVNSALAHGPDGTHKPQPAPTTPAPAASAPAEAKAGATDAKAGTGKQAPQNPKGDPKPKS